MKVENISSKATNNKVVQNLDFLKLECYTREIVTTAMLSAGLATCALQ